MADPNETEKENVRIALPSQPVAKTPGTDTRSRDTVRIQLPPRQPLNKVPLSSRTQSSVPPQAPAATSPPPLPVFLPEAPTEISKPDPEPSVPPTVSAAPDSISLGPKKETARIAIMPEPPVGPAPAVQMKKTQPLIPMPQISPQTAPVAAVPAEKAKGNAMMDAISMPACWTLLGVSAVILIIQIWTYFS
jgi:hypothetical protein